MDIADKAVVVGLDQAEVLELPAAVFHLLADSGASQGALGVNRLSLDAGANGAKPHYHAHSWELFYVIDGVMEFLLDTEHVTVAAGGVVLVPPGMVHVFGAAPGVIAEALVVLAPGVERFDYFRQIQRIALGQASPDSVTFGDQVLYDVRYADTPLWPPSREDRPTAGTQ